MTVAVSMTAVEDARYLPLLKEANSATAPEARKKAAASLATLIKETGVLALKFKVFDSLKTDLDNAKSAAAREGALQTVQILVESGLGRALEAFLMPLLPRFLTLCADKQRNVQLAAQAAIKAFNANISGYAVRNAWPHYLAALDSSTKWQTKVAALDSLQFFVKACPEAVRQLIPVVIPPVSETVWDTKADVKEGSLATLTAVCSLIGNRDIEKFIPAVISTIANPTEVVETVNLLGATTFVQAVDQFTLAIMVPLLQRALSERNTPCKRKTAVIIDNMCKLVEEPTHAAPFVPKLLPGLKKLEEEIADPEARGVVARAHATLLKSANLVEGQEANPDNEKKVDPKTVLNHLNVCIKAAAGETDEFFTVVIDYIAEMAVGLIDARQFDAAIWAGMVVPTLTPAIGAEHAESVCKSFLAKCIKVANSVDAVEEEDDEGEDLCNCEFSLAYGGKILLNMATLRLKKGRRYGLCGPNGVGKSTLLRAIVNGQVDGFPTKEEVPTVYVEHDIDGSDLETPVHQWITEDPAFKNRTKEDLVQGLRNVGFNDELLNKHVGALSGGWKMKLALARAILKNVKIILLDEPTNHLDVINVAWLVNYLTTLTDVTSVIVSHDSNFLDNVCTDIINYNHFKLRRYKGNLSEFVKKVPEARSYYDLGAAPFKFTFPEPGFLEGVKTKEKAIVKIRDADYQYPGSDRKQLIGVSMQCSLSSRVAVVGPNGAGKSTMIKLLTGELEPQGGSVWRHPNLRIAYVAQHAFHHLEQHLEKSPNQYVQWRFATGEDAEELNKVYRATTEEEEKEMSKVRVIEGQKRVVDSIVSRRKLKNSYEYEVSWVGMSSTENTWLPRLKLIELGFLKKVQEFDSVEASKLGLSRPLTQKEIEKHFSDVGLEPEFATHSNMKGLSGGQKVKVVIGAAMWQRPHILVMDEPTNYLDRDSLGALAAAIKEYGGGVVLITHNAAFAAELCPEVWTVKDGKLIPSGHNWVQGQGSGPRIEQKQEEETTDALGNTVKVKPQKALTAKELKKKKRAKELKKKAGEAVSDSEDDL